MPFRTRLAVPVIAIALLLTPALAGCSLVQGAVEDATGTSVRVDGSLPEGWPASVPVIEGKVLFGAGGQGDGGSGWVATIDATDADPIAAATKQLEDAGFTADGTAQAPSGDGGFVAMKNAEYTVLVAGTKDGVLYTVAPVTN
ncbi:MAG: hypothetical protein ABWY36_05965 [Leifsonia sp.]